MLITEIKSAKDWFAIREQAANCNDSLLWMKIFNDFFYGRLESRYLSPIKLLQEGHCVGEGFSIVTIQCSMVEFLESTFDGINYRYVRNKSELGEYEYNSSKECFISFLTKRYPFSLVFNEKIARDFYASVRCGLLHEASTKNGWKIWAASHSGTEIICSETKKVYRNDFQKALESYVSWYRDRLIESEELKMAFIRKFNAICE